MHLPFSHAEFLDVFGAYNTRLWPAAVLLWVLTAGLAAEWLRKGRMTGRYILALLAVHWAWSGIVYQWFFFRGINPAATLFGGLFVLQALLFAWLAATWRTECTAGWSLRGVLGAAFVVYGLAYPALGLMFGLHYPRLPLFAVPCPTTLVTAGFLLASTGAPRFINVAPVLWAAVGSSAAFALGVRADLALVPAGVLLAVDTLAPRALGARR